MAKTGQHAAPFLLKTYDLVDEAATDEMVSWSASGKSFVVWKPVEFSKEVLPKYFKHNNFSSFVRQLNTYGFRKIDPETWQFGNEYFIRGQRDLLAAIQRRKPNSTLPTLPHQNQQEHWQKLMQHPEAPLVASPTSQQNAARQLAAERANELHHLQSPTQPPQNSGQQMPPAFAQNGSNAPQGFMQHPYFGMMGGQGGMGQDWRQAAQQYSQMSQFGQGPPANIGSGGSAFTRVGGGMTGMPGYMARGLTPWSANVGSYYQQEGMGGQPGMPQQPPQNDHSDSFDPLLAAHARRTQAHPSGPSPGAPAPEGTLRIKSTSTNSTGDRALGAPVPSSSGQTPSPDQASLQPTCSASESDSHDDRQEMSDMSQMSSGKKRKTGDRKSLPQDHRGEVAVTSARPISAAHRGSYNTLSGGDAGHSSQDTGGLEASMTQETMMMAMQQIQQLSLDVQSLRAENAALQKSLSNFEAAQRLEARLKAQEEWRIDQDQTREQELAWKREQERISQTNISWRTQQAYANQELMKQIEQQQQLATATKARNDELEMRVNWQEKLANDQVEVNKAQEGRFAEQRSKNNKDAMQQAELQARLELQEKQHAKASARNRCLSARLAELERTVASASGGSGGQATSMSGGRPIRGGTARKAHSGSKRRSDGDLEMPRQAHSDQPAPSESVGDAAFGWPSPGGTARKAMGVGAVLKEEDEDEDVATPPNEASVMNTPAVEAN